MFNLKQFKLVKELKNAKPQWKWLQFSGAQNTKDELLNSLIADNKLDTPLMFLEKLGLGEIYVDYMNKSIDFDKLKKIITQNYNLAVNFSNFEKSANILIDNATTALANGEDYLNILNNVSSSSGLTILLTETTVSLSLKFCALTPVAGRP